MLTITADRLINKFNLVRAYRNKFAGFHAYPAILNIESSSLCNLKCPMCSREAGLKRDTGNMDLVLYKKIIDEVRRYTELVVLHNSGEPLMNRNIAEMAQYAGHSGLATMFSTNGTLLDEETGIKLIKSNLSIIVIAIDGATPNTYVDIRKGANLQQTETNLISLIRSKKRLGKKNPHIVLQFIEMENNRHETEAFKIKWSAHDLQIFIKPSTAHGRDIGHRDSAHCDRLWFHGVILSDGRVVPCCKDLQGDFAVGSIAEDALSGLWNSKAMQDVRKANIFGRGTTGLCKGCNYTPPRTHNIITHTAQCFFDMGTLARLLYRIGYNKKRQL